MATIGGEPTGKRLPAAAWIGVAVVGVHVLFFWVVWDKHFLPKVPPPPPTPPPVNFGASHSQRVDPRTGETVLESDFAISTHLAPPPPPAASAASP